MNHDPIRMLLCALPLFTLACSTAPARPTASLDPQPADLAPGAIAADMGADPTVVTDAGDGGSAPVSDPGGGDMSDSALAPTATAVDPVAGPPGVQVTVTGRGFRSGDVVQLSTGNAVVALATVSLASTLIVATLPSSTPAGVGNVTVKRASRVSKPLPFSVTSGRVYYLAPNGSDNNPGTLASPWATLENATAQLQPGDLLYLRGGSYSFASAVTSNGTAAAPITIQGYPGEQPLLIAPAGSARYDTLSIQGSYLTFDHLRISDLVAQASSVEIIASAHDVTLSNCDIYGSLGVGMIIAGSHNNFLRNRIHDNGSYHKNEGIYIEGAYNVLRGNLVYNNWDYGIQLYNELVTDGSEGHNLVEGNYVFHNGYGAKNAGISNDTAGMILSKGHANDIVRNNIFCDNADWALQVELNLPNQQVSGNVSCYNHTGGFFFPSPGSNNTFTNNISYNDAAPALSGMAPLVSDDNLYFSTSGAPTLQWNFGGNLSLAAFQSATQQDGHSKVANPGFKNVPSSGFDATRAESYDFCTALNPSLCTH